MFWKRDVSKLNEQQQNLEEVKEQIDDEEWITVEGYKGVDADLTGRNKYQFNLHQKHIISGDIEECSNGFHFCKTLKDVFDYYNIIGYYGVFDDYPSLLYNRYFKVSATVKKSDWECLDKDKFVAKEIYFVEEISRESSLFHESMIGISFPIKTDDDDHYIKITDENMAIGILNDFNKFVETTREKLHDEKMQIIKNSKERLFNAFTDNKLSELFFNIIVSDDATKNNEITKFTVALGAEGVSKDMLVYHILKATKFSEGFN